MTERELHRWTTNEQIHQNLDANGEYDQRQQDPQLFRIESTGQAYADLRANDDSDG